MSLLTQIFGSRNQRLLKQYQKTVREINALEPAMEKLSDAELQAKTPAFKERIANGEALDALLPEAFAVCREASKRVFKMRHFDVQLLGGMVLHFGKIAEMGTGEGKTLTATLPAYLNALSGKGVHIVTVNDYLAQRDAETMGKLYGWLVFANTVLIFVLAFFGLAYSIFPDIVIGRMTVWEAAISTASLNVIFIGVAITLPVIIGYTVFMYRVFWGKATALKYG
eukprot:gene23097-29290_t